MSAGKLVLIIIAACTIVLLPILAKGRVGNAATAENNPRPEEFRAIRTDGETIRLSDFRGNVVILDVFATWCEPCRQELPGLINLQNKIERSNLNLVILGAAIDTNRRDVQNYLQSRNVNFDVVFFDEREMKNFISESVPTKYIIDSRGVVVDKLVGGPWSDEQLLKRVEKFLK